LKKQDFFITQPAQVKNIYSELSTVAVSPKSSSKIVKDIATNKAGFTHSIRFSPTAITQIIKTESEQLQATLPLSIKRAQRRQ
jgi:hypothetical protein